MTGERSLLRMQEFRMQELRMLGLPMQGLPSHHGPPDVIPKLGVGTG
jgi:hypothetical protein